MITAHGKALLCVSLFAACSRAPGRQADASELDAQLRAVCARVTSSADALQEVRRWRVPTPQAWLRVTTAPFQHLHAAYADEFERAAPILADELQTFCGAPLRSSRQHYADDAQASLVQNRLRWIVPVGFPSRVVPGLSHVFVWDQDRWYSLAGADAAMREPLRALDQACWRRSTSAGLASTCSDASWAAVAHAIQGETEAALRGCRMMQAHCPAL